MPQQLGRHSRFFLYNSDACSIAYAVLGFPSKTNSPFLKLCRFDVGRKRGKRFVLLKQPMTAGRSSPVPTNAAFSYPCAFFSAVNPKTKPPLWRKSDL